MQKGHVSLSRLWQIGPSYKQIGELIGYSETVVSDIVNQKRGTTELEDRAYEQILSMVLNKMTAPLKKSLTYSDVRELYFKLIDWKFGKATDADIADAFFVTKAELMRSKKEGAIVKPWVSARIVAGACAIGLIPLHDDETKEPKQSPPGHDPVSTEAIDSIDNNQDFGLIYQSLHSLQTKLVKLEQTNKMLESEIIRLSQNQKPITKPVSPEQRQFLINCIDKTVNRLAGCVHPPNPLLYQALWRDTFDCAGVQKLNDIITQEQWDRACAYVFKRASAIGLNLTKWESYND